jgi:hypothetical protein
VLKNNFNFQDLLKQFVLEQLEKKENYKFILEFLLKDNISIVLDYKEWQELNSVSRYPVAHEKTVEFINNILQENEKRNNQNTKKTDENKMRKDAFGDDSDIIKDKLPKVRTYLGDVSLRSMTRESLCHTRYGNIESESYPISKSNIANIKKAIEWLSSNERKGKNWTPANSKELLFVYPSKICDIKLADMFGGRNDEDSNESSENIATFEKKAEDVVKALTKLSTNGNPIDIKLFAIKKIDDGHKNISYYRNYEAQKLIKSAEDWKNGCKNIPNMPFETKMPFPLDIAKIVNKLYKMDGTENEGSKKLKPTSSYQGLNLMLEENNSELSRYLLSILRDNYCGLIKYLGCSYNNRRKNDLKFDKNFRYIYIYPTIGLFLYKLQINKERYMESFPFLLGQMLKISDELHALWCEVVRKGNLPPQLAGNSLFSASLETPMSILVQLGQRINPYLAWAKQYRTKKEEKSGLATWYIRLYEENCNKLQQVLPNKSIIFNDVEKSQLFVGYLASFPKKQGDNNE